MYVCMCACISMIWHHLRALLSWRQRFSLGRGAPGIVNQTVSEGLGVRHGRSADVHQVPLRVATCVVCV